MTPALLRRLTELAEARRARDLARLDGLLTQDRQLAAEIAALSATLTRDLQDGAALPLARQAVRQAWVDQRLRAARRQQAALATSISAARAVAVQSLGKHRALDELLDRGERAVRQQFIARIEREAPPPEARTD